MWFFSILFKFFNWRIIALQNFVFSVMHQQESAPFCNKTFHKTQAYLSVCSPLILSLSLNLYLIYNTILVSNVQHSKSIFYRLHSISSVQSLSSVQLFVTLRTAACQASLSIIRAYSGSCPSSQWCHPTISSSVVPFSSSLQSSPASGSFHESVLHIRLPKYGVSALASVLPMNIQDWFPLGWIGWISLQSKGLSRVFSNTIVQKHQFFGTQLSLQSNSHIHTWLLENHMFD